MLLNLIKPIAIFDLETTGLNITKDRIVEIAIIKINPDGNEETFHSYVNPEIKIPKESAEIHGITDEKVQDSPTFKELASKVVEFIGEADLVGFNSNKFDIPVLSEELLRVGNDFDISSKSFIDVQNIFHKMEQRTLTAAYKFYCDEDMENAHSALYDTKVTWEVLKAQLNKYENLDKDVKKLADFSRAGNLDIYDFAGRLAINDKEEVIYNFGKNKGKTIEQVDQEEPGYYGWMMQADFPLYTKKCLKKEMDRIKAKRNKKVESDSIEDKLSALKKKFNS
ncbi:MAG: exonuclease domain-containing protein [Crocinitomicaceae bacterium]